MASPSGFTAHVSSESSGRVAVVALTGRLDPPAADILRLRVDELYQAGHRRFVFDLAGLEHVGSLGIQVFMQLAARVKADGLVYLCSPTPLVKEVLDVVRIGAVIRTYPTLRDAVDAAGTR